MNILSVTFWIFWIVFLFFVLYKKGLNGKTVSELGRTDLLKIGLFIAVFCIVCIIPMSFVPCYNGVDPGHHDQYERIAESFVNGHLYFDYDVDPVLLSLDNPYDLADRYESGASYHWDHAFYNGKYYMYFGVVPVILLFVPFRLLTGASLTGYHATQLFVVLFIVALFLFVYEFLKKFRPDFNAGLFLYLTSGLSLASVNNCIEAPALYNTAVSSGICFAMWSIYFFLKSVIFDDEIRFRYLIAASLCGALVFGCRPNIGVISLILIPVLSMIVKKYTNGEIKGKKLFISMLSIFGPYLVIGILLMVYNYVRFDSVFEFGQSYQLTDTDQHLYYDFLGSFDPKKFIVCFIYEFIMAPKNLVGFKAPGAGGLLTTFPVVWPFTIVLILYLVEKIKGKFSKQKTDGSDNGLGKSQKTHLRSVLISLIVAFMLILVTDILMSPYPLTDRYKGDVYFLFAIFYVALICYNYDRIKKIHYLFNVLFVLTVFMCFILYLTGESNYWYFFPDKVDSILNTIF